MPITKVDGRDSFKAYTTVAHINTYWANGQGIVAGMGAFGFPAIQCGGGGNPSSQFNVVGVAERMVSQYRIGDVAGIGLCTFHSPTGGGAGPSLGVLSDGTIVMDNAGVRQWNTAATAWQFSAQHHVEIYFKTGTTSVNGICQVWLDGALLTATFGSMTACDTRINASATDYPTILLFGGGSQNATWMSHFWTAQCTGASNVGPRRVEYLAPNAPGLFAQWTPVGVAANWDNVNEAPPDSTDYNKSNTVGQRDSFKFALLPAGATGIIDVARCTRANVDDGTSHQIRQTFDSGASHLNLPTYALPAVAAYTKEGSLTDPATAVAWLKAAVDAVDGGYEVIS